MIKQLCALAAGAVFSLNAAAGYVQYDLDFGAAGNGLSGFVVQHDTDHSIAFFSFDLRDSVGNYGQQFFPFNNDGAVLLTGVSTHFLNGGPTNFRIADDFGSDHLTRLSVDFFQTSGGGFGYTASYTANLYANQPPSYHAGTVSGTAQIGKVGEILAATLDASGGYFEGVPDDLIPEYVAPAAVPEPAGFGLLAIGAAGLFGALRRRHRNA